MKYSLLVKQGAHLTHINSMKPHNSVKQRYLRIQFMLILQVC